MLRKVTAPERRCGHSFQGLVLSPVFVGALHEGFFFFLCCQEPMELIGNEEWFESSVIKVCAVIQAELFLLQAEL